MTARSTRESAADPSPLFAEDYWPEPIDLDFEDDADEGFELEDWPLDEDVRRMIDER